MSLDPQKSLIRPRTLKTVLSFFHFFSILHMASAAVFHVYAIRFSFSICNGMELGFNLGQGSMALRFQYLISNHILLHIFD